MICARSHATQIFGSREHKERRRKEENEGKEDVDKVAATILPCDQKKVRITASISFPSISSQELCRPMSFH